MTNFEFYKDELLKMTDREFTITKDNTVKYCNDIDCKECMFRSTECDHGRFKWLYSEYKNPIRQKPELNEDERKLLELVKRGCIVRDENNMLSIIAFYPDWDFDKNFIKKDEKSGYWIHDNNNATSIYIYDSHHLNLKFSFVKWEDNEPWDIEWLLSNDEINVDNSNEKDTKYFEKNECENCEFDSDFKRYMNICHNCKRAMAVDKDKFPDLYIVKKETIGKCQLHDNCKNKGKMFEICKNCTHNVYYEETLPVDDHFKEKKGEE